MSSRNNDKIWIKAAIATGVASAFAAAIWSVHNIPRSPTKNGVQSLFKDLHIRNIKSDKISKNFIVGGMAGGLVAAATALLFTPKAGKDLVEDVIRSFKSHALPKSLAKVDSKLKNGRIAKKATAHLATTSTKKAVHAYAAAAKKVAKKKPALSKASVSKKKSTTKSH